MNLKEELEALLNKIAGIIDLVQSEGRAMTEDEQKEVDEGNKRAEEINGELEAQADRAKKIEESQKRASAIRSQVVNPLTQRKGTFAGKQNQKDLAKFSLGRALKQLINGRSFDGVEAEVLTEGRNEAMRAGAVFNAGAFVIPSEAIRSLSLRDRDTSDWDDGISTEAYGTIFEMFRDKQILTDLGATTFDGLVGNVQIPTQTGAGTTPALNTETGTATEVDATLNFVELTPTRVAAYTQLSNQLIMQSTPSVESFAVNNLMKSIFGVLQNKVFQGTASDAIKGIVNTTGVNISNVATANSPTWAEVCALFADLAGVDFDLNRAGYALNSTLLAKLMSTAKFTNGDTPIMSEVINRGGKRSLAGFKAGVSNAVGSGLYFGAWESLFLGQWGGVGIIHNPYTNAKNGKIEVTAETFMDAKIGNPDLFGVLKMEVA